MLASPPRLPALTVDMIPVASQDAAAASRAAPRTLALRPLAMLSGTSLRWSVGLFCTFIGAFILVAPHQFAGPPYEPMRGWLTAWAVAALVAGVALLSVAVLRTRRMQRLAAHGLAILVLLALALNLGIAGAWTGTVAYTVLGLGLLSRSALRGHQPRGATGDLLGLLMGIVATLLGAGLLLVPLAWRSPLLGDAHGWLPFVALALLATGPALARAQLRPLPRWAVWASHLAGGAALGAYGMLRAALQPTWTAAALYLGIGAAVALLPGLRDWSADLDVSALRTRLALALAVATSLALIATVAVSTHQEERLATAQALETLEVEARSVAQDVRDYVELNGARAATIAALSGQLLPAAAVQRRLLAKSRASYGDVTGLLLLDRDGNLLVADGGTTLGASTLRGIAAAAAASSSSPVELALDRATGRQLLLVGAPVAGRDGHPAGTLVMAFGSTALERRIAREGSIVSLADGYGKLVGRHDAVGKATSLLPAGWDRHLAQGKQPEVPERQPEVPERLIATARVPDFSWVVAIERPSASALAGVNRGRDMAFALLLFVLPLAIVAGILVARRIARPLGTLADAVDELTAGNPWAPLESSGISEVERLSAAFRDMRDRLALRTAESERLAAELRARAEALAESDRRKDEFLAMLAHELRNPLGAISTAAYILGKARQVEPPLARSVTIIQRQSQHLGRLVDDLLDVSRITRGKMELRRAPLDLGEVVKQAAETTRPLVEARHHRLEVSLPAAPLPLLADPTRLEQVLANLIRNAVKFTEPGGVIEVDAVACDGHAVVRVRDSGMGISSELLPRVFELFTQGQQGLDRSAGGLGIGLTLVRSLVEMHGGRVQVHSDGPGRGSEFTIWLPLATLPLATAEKLQSPVSS
jgi:signal transduction histidine kinase